MADRWISPSKWQVIQEAFPYHDVFMTIFCSTLSVILSPLLFWQSISIYSYSEMHESSICKRLPLTLSFDSCRYGNTHTLFSKWRHDIEILSVLLALCDRKPQVTGDFPEIYNVQLCYFRCCESEQVLGHWDNGVLWIPSGAMGYICGVYLSRLFIVARTIPGIILGMRPSSERNAVSHWLVVYTADDSKIILKELCMKYTFFDDLTLNQMYLSNCNMYFVII